MSTMHANSPLLVNQTDSTVTLTLNRPQKRNALNDSLIAELTGTLQAIHQDTTIQLVILKAHGPHFCAGADLNWLRQIANAAYEEKHKAIKKLALLFHTLDTLSPPILAVTQGAAMGGGAGLLACCDVVIGLDNSYFCFPETHLGLIPATITPYVVRAIGPRQAKALFITAEQFSAAEAKSMGLLHYVAKPTTLKTVEETVSKNLLAHDSDAVKTMKSLIALCCRPIDDTLQTTMRDKLVDLLSSTITQQRLDRFLN